VEEIRSPYGPQGNSLKDGPVGGREAGLGRGGRGHERAPAGDLAGLGRENEKCGSTIRTVGHDEVGRAIEHLPGWGAARDGHLERLLDDGASVDISRVDVAETSPVRRYPESPGGRAQGNSPAVDQIRVDERGHAGLVGNEVRGDVRRRGRGDRTAFQLMDTQPRSIGPVAGWAGELRLHSREV